MKKIFFCLLLGICSILSAEKLPITVKMERFNAKKLPGPFPSTRERICLNGIWDFYPVFDKEPPHGLEMEKLPALPSENEWKKFRVPAKWKRVSGTQTAINYEIPREWSKANRAWYKRNLRIPESMKNKRIKLQFGGILVYSEVFLNGKSLGKNYCGVLPFEFDITDKVLWGKDNEIKIYVTNQNALYIKKPKSRYNFTCRAPLYYGYVQNSAGIWQDVFLEAQPKTIIDDVFVKTSFRKKEIATEITLLNSSEETAEIELQACVEDLNGKKAKDLGSKKMRVDAGKSITSEFSSKWENPLIWNPETPNLYRLHTKILANGKLLDENFQRFGFREFWIEGKDFILNGRKITLTGDWVGFRPGTSDATLRPEYIRAQVKSWKEANYRGTRFNMAPKYIMDICDEEGLPIIATGISDGAKFFDPGLIKEAQKNAISETTRWIKRDRNHPCILIWSTENEDSCMKKDINKLYREVDETVAKLDPTRPFMHDGNKRAGGDLDGFAPIQNFHYTGQSLSLNQQVNQFVEWQKTAQKPRVEGEISNYGSEFSKFGGMYRLIGDKAWRSPDEVYKGFDWWCRLQSGAWRSCALSGFMLFGNQNSLFNAPINATFPGSQKKVLKFEWKDLNTPYPKPQYLMRSNMYYVNPWTSKAPEVIKTPIFYTIRDAYSPLIITLSRSIEHNYWSGTEMEKTVYAINESLNDLNGKIKWELSDLSGKIILSGELFQNLKTGATKSETIKAKLPKTGKRKDLKLKVNLVNNDKKLAEDWMNISIYPKPENIEIEQGSILLYDPKGQTEKLMSQYGIAYRKISIEEIKNISSGKILIIGAHSADESILSINSGLTRFIKEGGKMLVFEQKASPICSRSAAFVRAPEHPIFKGLPEHLYFWRTSALEMCASGLQENPYLRQIPLAQAVGLHTDLTHSDYITVISENAAGKGKALFCNLNMIDACAHGEPEAIIMFHNMLRYMSQPEKNSAPKLKYSGGNESRKFLEKSLYTPNIGTAKKTDLTEGLEAGDVLLIGKENSQKDLNAQKNKLAAFVKNGGIIICSTDWKEGIANWTPTPIEVKKLPQKIRQPWETSIGAFHLWKNSKNKVFDGLGDLFLFESRTAKRYYIGDQIPGLDFGFKKPQAPWQNAFQIVTKATCSYKGLRRRHYYESNGDSAVSILKYGKGLFILSTLPMRKGVLPQHLYGALLANLNVPSLKEMPLLPFASYASNASLKPAGKKDWRRFTPIDLIPYTNRDLTDKEAGDKLGGWDDNGENDMRTLPTGDYVFGNVPFHIIDINKDDPNGDRGIKLGHPVKACIVLCGGQRKYFPKEIKEIAVNKKARKIHFLHTATWSAGKDKEKYATYVLNYEDGSKKEIPVRNNSEIADWWKVNTAKLKKGSGIAWVGSNPVRDKIGLYRFTYYNPDKDKVIKSIDIISEGKAVPILLAITLQK